MRYIKATVIPSNILNLPTLGDAQSGVISTFNTDLTNALNKLKIAFSASQDLHGYSKPWIGGAGKNKVDILDKTFINNGTSVVCSKANQTVTITNTATSSGGRTQALTNVIHLTAGTYRPSATVVSGTLQGTYIVNNASTNTYIVSVESSFTLTEDTDVYIGVNVLNGTTYNETVKLQIEAGSTATSWEPYENICPITGFSQANVVRTGANIIGGETFADIIVDKVPNATKDTSEKTVTYEASRISNIELFNKFKPNTVYTIFISTKSGVPNLKVVYTDNSTTTLSLGLNTTASGKSVANIMGLWSSGTTVLYYDQFGVLEGSLSAGDFVPYHGNTYLLQFGDTYYGCEIDVVHGKLRVLFKLYTFTGTETWNLSGTSFWYFSTASIEEAKTAGATVLTENGIVTKIYNQPTLRIIHVYLSDNPSITSSTDMNTIFPSGSQLLYELATPIEVDIDSAIITALTGEVNQVYCDIPTSNVEELQFFETVGRHIQ